MPVGTGNTRVTYVTDVGDEVTADISTVDARRIAEGIPVRDFPVYVGRRNYSGFFWSSTMRRHVVYESLLELSWLWLADFDPTVLRIAAQPMALRGPDAVRMRNRIPDFITVMRDGTIRVIDVKPSAMLAKTEVTASLSWTGGVVRDRGWEYEVWTGPEPTMLRNVRWLSAARPPHVSSTLDLQTTSRQVADGCTFEVLERRLRGASRPAPRMEILGALWQGKLRCDLSQVLDSRTWLEPAVE